MINEDKLRSVIASLGATADDVAKTVAYHCSPEWCKSCLCGTCPIQKCVDSALNGSALLRSITVNEDGLACSLSEYTEHYTSEPVEYELKFRAADYPELQGIIALIKMTEADIGFWLKRLSSVEV